MTSNRMEASHEATARRDGWVAAPKAEVSRLVRDGILERISGKGRGMGNTPCWAPTASAAEAWASEAGTGRMVRVTGTTCEVLEELEGGRLVVLRRGERVTVPAAIARPV